MLGKPASAVQVRLDKYSDADGFGLIARGATNDDGRCPDLLQAGSRVDKGVYKMTFFTNECVLRWLGECYR